MFTFVLLYDEGARTCLREEPSHTDNELREIRLPETGNITIPEYDWNRPARIEYPGGSRQEFDFDGLMRLTQLTALASGGDLPLLDYAYTYDTQGNIREKMTEHGTYSYDDDGLIAEYGPGGMLQKSYGWQPDSTWGTAPLGNAAADSIIFTSTTISAPRSSSSPSRARSSGPPAIRPLARPRLMSAPSPITCVFLGSIMMRRQACIITGSGTMIRGLDGISVQIQLIYWEEIRTSMHTSGMIRTMSVIPMASGRPPQQDKRSDAKRSDDWHERSPKILGDWERS